MSDLPYSVDLVVRVPFMERVPGADGYVRLVPGEREQVLTFRVCEVCAAVVLDPEVHLRSHDPRR